MKAIAAVIVILSICMVLMSLSMDGSLLAWHSHAADYNVSERVSNMYLAAVGKPPPSNYGRWVAFAAKRNCHIDPRHYSQLYKDLKPWIDAGRIDHSVFDAVGGAPNEWTGSQFTGPGLTESFDSGGGFNISHKGWDSCLRNNEIKVLFDKRPFRFYFNGMDNPRSLPSYNTSSKFLNRAYDNPTQVFDDNKCFRERFGRTNFSKSTGNPIYDLISNKTSIRENHGYFMNPVPWKSVDAEVPFFTQCKSDCYADILMPQFYALISTSPIKDRVKWEDKKNVLFWHGTTTGSHYGDNIPWRKSHRVRLVQWAKDYGKKYPDRIFEAASNGPIPEPVGVDIGFTALVHSFESAKEVLDKEFGMKKFYDFKPTLKFKYLLVVDGHTWPGRLQGFLQTNSVILYNGVFMDWWNARLKPWEHYVPVQVDFSDLEEKLEWLLRNDDKARQISINAQLVAKQMSRYDEAMCYTGLLMTEYADLYFRGSEKVDTP
ncbi:glycosyl transferase family 90-domain-containing protein [Chytriomyces cf. hyalinus JEL632]|nr:glycosyl transferase family 90-domain-containing protein [Chytriomyces cf. hyalinus JEL632]